MFYVVPFFFSFFLLHLSRSLWFYLSTPRNQPTGFKRVTTQNNSAAHAYCHHLFQRERPNLCTKMKGDGGLRATDEERQAAAAVGIDPRRAAGIEGLTPAQLAQRQVELEMERRLRKAGVDVDSEKKKSPVPPPAYAAPAAPAAPSVPASAADGVGGTGTAGASAVAAGATAFVHPTPSTALASEVGPLMAELEYLRRLREKKGQLQAQAALSAALSQPRGIGGVHQGVGGPHTGSGGSGSPFLRPPAASGASALAGSHPGGAMLGAGSGGLVQSPSGGPLSSSTTLLDHQLRLQQQLEIEHERLYLERIRQARQLEEQRLRTIHSQQLLQQQQLSAGGVLPPSATNVFPSGRFNECRRAGGPFGIVVFGLAILLYRWDPWQFRPGRCSIWWAADPCSRPARPDCPDRGGRRNGQVRRGLRRCAEQLPRSQEASHRRQIRGRGRQHSACLR